MRFVDLDSEHIALWACLFGYADAGRDMVRCTGHTLPSVPPISDTARPAEGEDRRGRPDRRWSTATLEVLTDCFAETANDYAVSFDKALNGAYRPDDFAKDVARFWDALLNDMSKFMPSLPPQTWCRGVTWPSLSLPRS